MTQLVTVFAIAALGCGSPSTSSGSQDGPATGSDAPAANHDATREVDASSTLGSTFRFAIVGDTRPPNDDDTAHYPTAIITKIWSDVQATSPRPDFAISTGDYQFSKPTGIQAAAQLDIYLNARHQFTNTVYAALGNHECTGATDSNCGMGATDGITRNYTEYMTRMVEPLGFTHPYYAYRFQASDASWTAKVVVVAANAWDATQKTWLDTALADPTTYTFVVRHEDDNATTAPGVTPSKAIIAAHPVTLKIYGHTHTYAHYKSEHSVICGNGGAPLTSGTNYGYAILERLASGTLQFTEYDYSNNAVLDQFRINADGSTAP